MDLKEFNDKQSAAESKAIASIAHQYKLQGVPTKEAYQLAEKAVRKK